MVLKVARIAVKRKAAELSSPLLVRRYKEFLVTHEEGKMISNRIPPHRHATIFYTLASPVPHNRRRF